MSPKRKLFFLATVILLIVIGIYFLGRNAGVPEIIDEHTISMPTGTQGSYDGLRIGLKSVRRAEYKVEETGELREGRVADLVIFFKDDPVKGPRVPNFMDVTVYIGQLVAADEHIFRVEDIKGGDGLVVLKFEK